MFSKLIAAIFFVTILFACAQQKKIATYHYKDYKIEQAQSTDSAVLQMLSTYSDSIQKTMNKVIGFSLKGLTKKQPESELGNFMTDCMKIMAEKKFNKKVDAAFVNYGGIRSYLPKGNITTGNIFELMPFDNVIVIQEVKGSVLKLFLNKIAERGGWPVSGMRYQIKNKLPQNILINDVAIDYNKIYSIANTDYIAIQGGDDCAMLKGLPTLNMGYLFRDALIAYIIQQTQEGKPIESKIEGRITY